MNPLDSETPSYEELQRRLADAEARAEHPGFAPGRFVMLTVSDDGCGMDEETRKQIFEPFFTTKKSGEGTGLGLATIYGIVKQNRGFINVYSEVGKGTTFRIYFPTHESLVSLPPSEQLAAGPSARGFETVLLVEDENAILALGTRILERLGYNVLAAGKPSQAIEPAKRYDGEIHLLITDVIMPEMNGRELAASLAGVHPEMRCLFMSGYTANVIAHHGVLDEGVSFIQKPFSSRDLAEKVRSTLDEIR